MVESFSEGGSPTLRIRYDIPVDYLTDIDNSVLSNWENKWQEVHINHDFPQSSEGLSVHPLDKLYELKQ